MDYLKALHENPDLAEEFDSLFDFFLLDELSPRDEADGRATFTLPGMAFARDGSGGEYHLLLLPEMAPAENTTCWKMAPSAITAAKVRQAVWLRAWMTFFH